jgi:hypothetical protein
VLIISGWFDRLDGRILFSFRTSSISLATTSESAMPRKELLIYAKVMKEKAKTTEGEINNLNIK